MKKDRVRRYTKLEDGTYYVQSWDTGTYARRSIISIIFHSIWLVILFILKALLWILKAPFVICKTLASSWGEGKPTGLKILFYLLAVIVTVIIIAVALFIILLIYQFLMTNSL